MRVQYNLQFDFDEEESEYRVQIPDRIRDTIIDTPQVPATGDIIDLWDITKHVDLSFDQQEWLIDIIQEWQVISVVHKDELAVVTLTTHWPLSK